MTCPNRDWCVMLESHFGECRSVEEQKRREKYSYAIWSAFHDSWDVHQTQFTNHHCDNIFKLVSEEMKPLEDMLHSIYLHSAEYLRPEERKDLEQLLRKMGKIS